MGWVAYYQLLTQFSLFLCIKLTNHEPQRQFHVNHYATRVYEVIKRVECCWQDIVTDH